MSDEEDTVMVADFKALADEGWAQLRKAKAVARQRALTVDEQKELAAVVVSLRSVTRAVRSLMGLAKTPPFIDLCGLESYENGKN